MTEGAQARRVRAWLVVPCYNEAERLDVDAFRSYLIETSDVGFVFVNDGSRDATLPCLERVREGFERQVEVLDQQPNQGKAEAVRVGMLRAFELGGDYAGYFDADLATPLSEIGAFVQTLDAEAPIDMVMGARVALLGRRIERKAVRHYLGRVFATGASMVLGLPVYDTQCGAKLLRVRPELRVLFEAPFDSRWIFDVELLARYLTRGGTAEGIYELPLRQWTDVGDSKVKSSDFLRAGAEMATIYRTYKAHQDWEALLALLSAPFFRYAAAGALGTAVHYLSLAVLVEAFEVPPARGTIAGAFLGAMVNYLLNYYFTFASKLSHRRTLPRFLLVAALSAAANGAGMWLLTRQLALHYLLAQVICTLGVLLLGFLINKAWTFGVRQAGR